MLGWCWHWNLKQLVSRTLYWMQIFKKYEMFIELDMTISFDWKL